MSDHPYAPPTVSRLIVKRGGKAITGQVPKPTVIIDTREQLPYSFSAHPNWIGNEVVGTLPTGDYSLVGMEELISIERKSLSDLLGTLTQNRERFIRECERLAQYPYRAILIEATLEDIKNPARYSHSDASPNSIVGTLDAIQARWNIPILYTSRVRSLAIEKCASLLSKYATYHFLESNGLGRILQDGDL